MPHPTRSHPEPRRLRRPPRILPLALASAVLWAAACAPAGRAVGPGPDSFWLASTGFQERADWPSVTAHLGPDEIGTSLRLSSVLGRVESLVLVPGGEGWGVHLTAADGEAGCELDVWLNGVQQLRGPGNPSPGPDGLISGRAVTALEVHRGVEGPVRDPEGCGALLLWSEEAVAAWDAPFRGRLAGRIRGGLSDTVALVRLGDGRRVRPDTDGRWVLGDLRPGPREVIFETAGGVLARQRTRVFAHAETRVDIQVGPAGRR